MWKGVWAILLAAGCVLAQPYQSLLLPEAVHIVGVVVDAEGKPIAGAYVDHTNDLRNSYQTNSEGTFELDTRAPALVIRKNGYRGEFVLTRDSMAKRITLKKVTEIPTVPVCPRAGKYDGVDGSPGSFQFQRIAEVKSKRGQDIDYVARSYYVKTRQGRKEIVHGSGALWDFGTPSDRDVWRSVKYDEVAYKDGQVTIVDARGQFSNGNRWHYLGKFGESASYSDVDEATAKILDRFLDGVCLKPAR